MADFQPAFEKTIQHHEGGYSHDPIDAGGETYKGVSRRFNPGWDGWIIIDAAKKKSNFPLALDSNGDLQRRVKSFYKQTRWDAFQGDLIPDQAVAEELFDTGVNMGIHRAVVFLQKGLNSLNRDGRTYPDISEDGQLGDLTLGSLRLLLAAEKSDLLLKVMNVYQGMHYLDYMQRSQRQERFARGWFKRVTFAKG